MIVMEQMRLSNLLLFEQQLRQTLQVYHSQYAATYHPVGLMMTGQQSPVSALDDPLRVREGQTVQHHFPGFQQPPEDLFRAGAVTSSAMLPVMDFENAPSVGPDFAELHAREHPPPLQFAEAFELVPTTPQVYPLAAPPVAQTAPVPARDTRPASASPPSKVPVLTVIHCGIRDPLSKRADDRVYTVASDFFGKKVPVYTAAEDPNGEMLFRASMLAQKYSLKSNMVGMYFARRRRTNPGIFQASEFKYKPVGATGIKSKAYFVTEKVCREFHEYASAQKAADH